MNISLLSSILSEYGIRNITGFLPVEGGIINQTYLIETGLGKFVLQGLNPAISVDAIFTQNLISQHCSAAGIVVPSICRTHDNLLFVSTPEKTVWRLTQWIDHGPRSPVGKHVDRVAGYLARFHEALEHCDHKPPKLTIPHFHHHSEVASTLKTHLSDGRKEQDVGFGHAVVDMLESLTYEPIRTQLIHADPKWNNFLFTPAGDVAAIIDLDTIMLGDIMIDIGDAFRSWCKTAENDFDRDLFDHALAGYNCDSKLLISETEALKATKILALELSARYLIDTFEDSYFGYDSSKFRSRKDHNLFRASQYFEYAGKIK